MSFSFFARDWATNRELFRRKPAHLFSPDEGRGATNLILFHGWHSLYAPLVPLEGALRNLPEAKNTRFWRATYDSHWKPFPQSAREFLALFKKAGIEPHNTILVGFSMGGIVSRALVADGFDARAVITLGTPHLGPAPWMPPQWFFGDSGSLSIAPRSKWLARLNHNSRDRAARARYHFYALMFTDATGEQHHDRIVMEKSALGEGLEGVATRQTIRLKYPGLAPGCDPHLRGMDPEFVSPALEKCREILANQTS